MDQASQRELDKAIKKAIWKGFNGFLGRESRKLGITEDELCKQIADEAKHRREEREKNCPLADPT